MAAPVAGLFATLGLDDGPWAAGLRRASQQARDFRSVQEREFRATTAATEGMSRSMRGSLGNVAQQIQDVAVQFQSGTSAAVIFAQQGPQILSAFGPLGGMFGALAGVTAVAAGALLGLGKEADSAKAASNALESATKTLDSAIAGSATSVDDLAGKYRVLSEEMRALERLKLEKVIRDSTTAIEEQKKALAESVRNLVDPKQLDVLERAAKIGQQLNPQYQAPAAAQDNLKFLQDTAKAAKEALDRGDFVGLAKQVDQFAKSSASAEKAFRGFAEGMIGPAESVIKANDAIEKANEGLGQLASGGPAGSGRARDPFAGFKDAPKELSRVREEIQRGLDSIAQTVAEKKAVVDREFAETASAITKQRSVPGADQHLLDEVEAQAKRLHQARLTRIDEEAAKEAEAEKKRVAAASRRTEALAREIEQNQRLIDAGKQSADAYEQMRRVIEAENKAIAAGLDPKGREARILAEQTKALDEQTEARKRNARAAEEQAKAHEKFYDDIGKRIGGMLDESAANENRQAENLQQNLQQNVASAVERGFQDGFASTDQIVAQFGSLLTSTLSLIHI
jgi:chromosome segregation ATPase